MNSLTLAHALNGSSITEFSGYDFSGQCAKRGDFSGRTFTDCLFRNAALGSRVEVRGGRVCLSVGDNPILRRLLQVATVDTQTFSYSSKNHHKEEYERLPLCGFTIHSRHITALVGSISFLGDNGRVVARFMSLPAFFQQDEFLLALGVRFVR